MTTATISALRQMTRQTGQTYRLIANGRVIMFGISRERAVEYSRHYHNASVVAE